MAQYGMHMNAYALTTREPRSGAMDPARGRSDDLAMVSHML